jgi:hypothetical protein
MVTLEDDTTETERLSDCLDFAVVAIARTIKDHLFDTLGLKCGSQKGSHFPSALYRILRRLAEIGEFGVSEGLPDSIIDSLDRKTPETPKYRDPRTEGRARNLGANTTLTLESLHLFYNFL